MKAYDYLIAGAGSAGCVLASRLSRAGYRVLVIEAGGTDRRFWIKVPIGYGKTYFDTRVNWCYETLPEPNLGNRSSYWPRGKVVGGSSSINAMVYYRGLPHDFNDWSKVAGPEWSWDAVTPAFDSVERFQSAKGRVTGNGPLTITDPGSQYHAIGASFFNAAQSLGFDLNPNLIHDEGVGRYCITAHNGVRCSAATAFLNSALKQPNLDLIKNARTTRILFEGRKAVGVEFRLRDRLHQVFCNKEVVLSAGAINTPQLLQLSGIGPGKLLSSQGISVRADRPAVGGNLQDHLAITYFYKSRIPTLNNQLYPWWGKAWAGMRYLLTRTGPLSLGVNQFGGFVRSRSDLEHPDLQLYFNPITYSKTPKGTRPLLNPDPYAGFIMSFQPCRPLSRGRVDIRSIDPLVPPDIKPNYLSEAADLDTVIDGGRLIGRLSKTQAVGDITLGPIGPTPGNMSESEIISDFRDRADTVFHPVGTCAMGRDPTTTVVDSRLKVHGFEGLRVVDASVFPNVTSGNTNAPTIMVAYKAASMILDDANASNGTTRAHD